jgi:uncharacterized protein (TIGR00251 family)
MVQLAEAMRSVGPGTEIDILVSPNAKRCEIGPVDPWRKRLVVKVAAPPEGGRANRDVEELFSEVLHAKATIVHGQTARMKTVQVQLDLDTVLQRLGEKQ